MSLMKGTLKFYGIVALLLFTVRGDAVAFAQRYEVRDHISAGEREKFSYLLSRLKIDLAKVLVADAQIFTVLRLQDAAFCIRDACMTFVVTACSSPPCPSASAVVGREFWVSDEVFPGFGGGPPAAMVSFVGTPATFLIGENFVTVRVQP